jgi:hypothetical protein
MMIFGKWQESLLFAGKALRGRVRPQPAGHSATVAALRDLAAGPGGPAGRVAGVLKEFSVVQAL